MAARAKPPKTPKPPASRRAARPKGAATRPKSTSRSQSRKKTAGGGLSPGAASREEKTSPEKHARLGQKHTCFKCNLKFYDLNRPEPTCPRCGTDQRQRPKVSAVPPPAPPPPPRRAERPMAPLLDEDEEPVTFDEEETELGLEGFGEGDEELFPESDLGNSDEDFED